MYEGLGWSVLVGLAQLTLIVVFAIAGSAKIRDLREVRSSFVDFGIPQFLLSTATLVLPVAELAAALFLLLPPTMFAGAAISTLLATIFACVILANLLQGRRPKCQCFGASSNRITWTSFVRSVAMIALSAVVVFSSLVSPERGTVYAMLPKLFADLTSIVLWLVVSAVLFQGWFSFHLLRQQGRLLLMIDALQTGAASKHFGRERSAAAGLSIGENAPVIEGVSLSGQGVRITQASHPLTLLLFVDPHCEHCRALGPLVERWMDGNGHWLNVFMISRGSPDDHVKKFGVRDSVTAILQDDAQISNAFGVIATPSAVFIDSQWLIGSHTAMGIVAIEELVGGHLVSKAHAYAEPEPRRHRDPLQGRVTIA